MQYVLEGLHGLRTPQSQPRIDHQEPRRRIALQLFPAPARGALQLIRGIGGGLHLEPDWLRIYILRGREARIQLLEAGAQTWPEFIESGEQQWPALSFTPL